MIDLLAHDSAFDVVDSERQRYLREELGHHDPVCLDVLEVVEEQATDCKIAKVVESGGCSSLSPKLDAELVVIRMIGERDVSEKATRLILQRAKNPEMLHSIFESLYVAIEHRAVRANAEPVRSSVNCN